MYKQVWLVIVITLCLFVSVVKAASLTSTGIETTSTLRSGQWKGVTSNGQKVTFLVSPEGSFVTEFNVFAQNNCAVSTGSNQLAITNNRFSHSDPLIKVSGQFSTTDSASGTYSLSADGFCNLFSQSGTWTAQAPPPPQAYLPLVLNQQGITPTVTPTVPTYMIDGLWRGNSTQNNLISFEINEHGFISFTTSYQIGGCGGTSSTFGGTIPIIGNNFVYGQPASNGAFIFTTGVFDSDTTASGTIKVTGSPCGNSTGTWTATKQNSNESRSKLSMPRRRVNNQTK